MLHSYRVERKSEDFGATKVYEARAIYDGNRKVSLVAHLKELADQRFIDELERTHALMRMVPHPNIMHVFDYFSADKFIFEVFAYNEGGRLSDHMHEKVRLRETHAGIVLYQLLGAVAEMHKARVFYGGTFCAEDVFVYHLIRAMLCVRVRDRPTPSGVLAMPFLRVGEPKRVERKQVEPVLRCRKRLVPSDSSPLLRTHQPELSAPVRKLRNVRGSPVARSIQHTGMLFSGHEELPR